MKKILFSDIDVRKKRIAIRKLKRKGLDNKTIGVLKELKPEKIVYISCNPATLARDLALLDESYEIKEVQPVDMFPFSKHVENVTVLKIK